MECNHQGRSSLRPAVEALARHYRLIPVCPEVLGGLSTPRPAAELQRGRGHDVLAGSARVRTAAGDDVTAAYLRGAAATVALALASGARAAVLKARSPSCGASVVYDGTFSGTRIEGSGVTVAALRDAGIDVRSDEDQPPGPDQAG